MAQKIHGNLLFGPRSPNCIRSLYRGAFQRPLRLPRLTKVMPCMQASMGPFLKVASAVDLFKRAF